MMRKANIRKTEKSNRQKLIRKMNRRFFDLASDGTLIYRDPIIGLLENLEKQVTVRLGPAADRLQLISQGSVVEEFAFTTSVELDCQSAMVSYFRLLESLYRDAAQAALAA